MPDSGFDKAGADDALVVLRAGESELSIAPAAGGAIAAWRTRVESRAVDWLRPADAAAIVARDAGGMGCFPLVPFSNRIREGTFRFGGRTIRLPLNVPGQRHVEHGHGWQAPWRVLWREAAMLAIEYRHAADAWPFPYVARQTFRLGPNGLTVELALENAGAEPMPAGLGLHPYFPRTSETTLTAPVAQMWETDAEVMPMRLVDPPPRCRLDRGIRPAAVALDNGFTGWSGRAAIAWPERRARLTMTAGGPLGFLVVYTPKDEDFFCAEPVSHCTDAFNLAAGGRKDTGMIVLESGGTVAATVRFAVEIEER